MMATTDNDAFKTVFNDRMWDACAHYVVNTTVPGVVEITERGSVTSCGWQEWMSERAHQRRCHLGSGGGSRTGAFLEPEQDAPLPARHSESGGGEVYEVRRDSGSVRR